MPLDQFEAALGGAETIRAFTAAGGRFTDQQDQNGRTAAMFAACAGADAIRAFVAAGGRFTDQQDIAGWTAGVWAYTRGAEAVEALAEFTTLAGERSASRSAGSVWHRGSANTRGAEKIAKLEKRVRNMQELSEVVGEGVTGIGLIVLGGLMVGVFPMTIALPLMTVLIVGGFVVCGAGAAIHSLCYRRIDSLVKIATREKQAGCVRRLALEADEKTAKLLLLPIGVEELLAEAVKRQNEMGKPPMTVKAKPPITVNLPVKVTSVVHVPSNEPLPVALPKRRPRNPKGHPMGGAWYLRHS